MSDKHSHSEGGCECNGACTCQPCRCESCHHKASPCVCGENCSCEVCLCPRLDSTIPDFADLLQKAHTFRVKGYTTAFILVRGTTCGSCIKTISAVLQTSSAVFAVEAVLLANQTSVVLVALQGPNARVLASGENPELEDAITDVGYEATTLARFDKALTHTCPCGSNCKCTDCTCSHPSAEVRLRPWKKKMKARGLHTVTFGISGMTCSSCVGINETALASVPGVFKVKVSLGEGKAVVASKNDLSVGDLFSAVENVGYNAHPISSKKKGAANLKEKAIELRKPKFESIPMEAVTTDESSLRKVSLAVGGMTCTSCVQTIENFLATTPGVHNAKVTLSLGRADVVYDPEHLAEDDIKEAINDLGYEAGDLQVSAPGTLFLEVGGMTCASCVSSIENYLGTMDGIKEVGVNLLTKKAKVV